MTAQVLAFPADPAVRPLTVAASRFVTIKLFHQLTGITESAVTMKIHRGIWIEGRQFVRRDGRILMDMEGYERWAETGQA
jgi:hypothetical protein